MENLIVKFKNDLKKYQSTRKNTLKKCKEELLLLSRIVNLDKTILETIDISDIGKTFILTAMIGAVDETIKGLFDKNKRKQNKVGKLYNYYMIDYQNLLKI